MKKLLCFIVTIVILAIMNYIIMKAFDVPFIDYSFVVGLMGMVAVYFFNTSGGIASRNVEMKIQSQTGIKVDQQKKQKFYPTISFYAAIFYTVVAAALTFFYYKDYFI
ncbi:hypothetical protein [Bacillus sp. REN10]|uniref:hypothetical protein n=1 Tax=Bacillus sp. REN10 TaxID=2782541 RepID=UPI00193BDEEB|nr:hypothetical protein [Bacillus sp. REN10]